MNKLKYVVIALLIATCFLRSAFGAITGGSIPEKFQRGYSSKDLYDYLKYRENYNRISLTHFKDGESEDRTYGDIVVDTREHSKMQLKAAFVELIEAPDSSTTTLTVRLFRAYDSQPLTDTLTFTEGTHSTGDVQAFTVTTAGTDADVLGETDALKLLAVGTTVTAGEVVVHTEWKGIE